MKGLAAPEIGVGDQYRRVAGEGQLSQDDESLKTSADDGDVHGHHERGR
jgi:hypothetical protein